MMNKVKRMKIGQTILVAFVIFLCSTAFAQTLSEITLADLGVQNYVVEGTELTKCFETPFSPTSDLNAQTYGIVSVNAEFAPVPSKKSTINVYINDFEIDSVKTADFLDGFARFNIPQEKILPENLLKICATTSFETQKITILNGTKIGYYLMPDFEKNGAFEIVLKEKEIRLLEEFTVIAVLKNYGSRDAGITLKYRRDDLEKETPETELVKGSTKISTTIPACKKRAQDLSCIEPSVVQFEYLLRPKLVGNITLLPATVEFQNPFGETVLLESNRPTIAIVEPEIKIRPFISVEKEEYLVGEKINAKLLITNEGAHPLYNLFLSLEPSGLAILKGDQQEVIEIINSNQTIEKEFTLSSVEKGEFSIGCKIDYLDYNVVQSKCSETQIVVQNPALDITIMGAIALVVISIGIYVYLHLKK